MLCKHVFLVDNVVALIPNNEFQPLHCFHVHTLNKMTNIENQQCQQQQTMSFGNCVLKKCVHCKQVFLVANVVMLIPHNEFQPLWSFHVQTLNKITNIENQQC